MPLMNTIGKNTAIDVSVEAVTAIATSLVPERAASKAPRPASRFFVMLSRITTDVSTRVPTESAIPPSDMMLSVTPERYMSMNVPITDTGITMPATYVARASRRKKYNTRMDSSPPITAASRTSPIADEMNFDWS